jgi:Uma2 family endonuclease
MTQAARKLTFEEYINLDAEDWVQLGLPEGRCEYVDGELIEVPSESGLNDLIAHFLFLILVGSGIPFKLVRIGRCEIEVQGQPRTRYPDLVVLREEHLALTQKRLLITRQMPNPQLVIEVVSPGDKHRRRDYEAKREQYQERDIPEYWLIDPEQQIITVLSLENGPYSEFGLFKGGDRIASPRFPSLTLTAAQVFSVER